MSDRELITTFINTVDKTGLYNCISTILGVTISIRGHCDIYKGKKFDWNSVKDSKGASTWELSLAYLMDDEMRDKIKKYLIKYL